MKRYFKTGKRLAIAIDNSHRINGFEEWLEDYLLSLYDLNSFDDIIYDLPYFIEPASLRDADPESDDYAVEAIRGYHVTYPRLGDIVDLHGGKYKVIDTIPMSTELELQADDGEFHVCYMGHNYLKIYQRIAD